MQPSGLEPEHRPDGGHLRGGLRGDTGREFPIVGTPNTDTSAQYILARYINSTHKREQGISTVLADIAVVFGIFWVRLPPGSLGSNRPRSPAVADLAGESHAFRRGVLVFSRGINFALLDSPRHMTSDTTQGMGRAFCVSSNDSHVLSPRERPSVVLSGFV